MVMELSVTPVVSPAPPPPDVPPPVAVPARPAVADLAPPAADVPPPAVPPPAVPPAAAALSPAPVALPLAPPMTSPVSGFTNAPLRPEARCTPDFCPHAARIRAPRISPMTAVRFMKFPPERAARGPAGLLRGGRALARRGRPGSTCLLR